jgi:hypothetical protein
MEAVEAVIQASISATTKDVEFTNVVFLEKD